MLTRQFQLPDGRIEEFTIKHEGASVCVLALTSDERVILAKQFRPGPEKVLLELPGGGMERGETLEQAVRREMLEETGYAGEVVFVTTALDCAYSTAVRHVFVATNCVKVQEPQLDANEFVEIVLMPLSDFRTHLRSGQLSDIEVGYLGLDALGKL
jgi:ADP-ribose pyrophosphatase